MTPPEIPLSFECAGRQLIGILHGAPSQAHVGILMVVGGHQYRIGSHRQFVLLARYWASLGIPVMRFDYRGMGDSESGEVSFDTNAPDIRSAVDEFYRQRPGMTGVVLWGLCDGGAGSMLYAGTDPRVKGVVVLNPWVRTEAGEAKTYLKHYYVERVMTVDFWKKLFSGRWKAAESLGSVIRMLQKVMAKDSEAAVDSNSDLSLPQRLVAAFEGYSGRVLLILSGRDFVADEFRDLIKSNKRLGVAVASSRVMRIEYPEANHTFSNRVLREQVAEWTWQWFREEFDDDSRS